MMAMSCRCVCGLQFLQVWLAVWHIGRVDVKGPTPITKIAQSHLRSSRVQCKQLTAISRIQPKLLPIKLDVSTSIRGLHQKKLVLSSSGSWHDGKAPCQESGRTRGSVGSCPHHGLWPVVIPFGCVWPIFDPSAKTLWLSVDHRRLRPVDDMVLLSCVVGESVFVVFY